MNRFPAWKYALIALCIVVAFVYTIPNFFGESPAVQVSSGKATVKVDSALLGRSRRAATRRAWPIPRRCSTRTACACASPIPTRSSRQRTSSTRRSTPIPPTPRYIVALNLLSSSPNWLTAIGALPMYLGLDLRGGVHFLLQVDMEGATHQAPGKPGGRPAHAAARKAHPSRRHPARGPDPAHALPRRAGARPRPRPHSRQLPRPCARRARRR